MSTVNKHANDDCIKILQLPYYVLRRCVDNLKDISLLEPVGIRQVSRQIRDVIDDLTFDVFLEQIRKEGQNNEFKAIHKACEIYLANDCRPVFCQCLIELGRQAPSERPCVSKFLQVFYKAMAKELGGAQSQRYLLLFNLAFFNLCAALGPKIRKNDVLQGGIWRIEFEVPGAWMGFLMPDVHVPASDPTRCSNLLIMLAHILCSVYEKKKLIQHWPSAGDTYVYGYTNTLTRRTPRLNFIYSVHATPEVCQLLRAQFTSEELIVPDTLPTSKFHAYLKVASKEALKWGAEGVQSFEFYPKHKKLITSQF